jgi:hypothetical protein
MFMCMYTFILCFVLSCVGQGVLPTVLDKETEVKRKVSWMPHAPVGVKKGI